MQNFVLFYPIEPEIKLSQEMWKKRNSSAPYSAISIQIASFVISNDIYFAYKFLSNFICEKPRSAYPKNFRKSETTAPSVE